MPLDCTEWWFTYCLLVFAELRDLSSLLLHPGDQPLQFSLQIFPLLGMLGCIYLTHQLLVLADTKTTQKQKTKCVK